jgi:hypothetical protein
MEGTRPVVSSKVASWLQGISLVLAAPIIIGSSNGTVNVDARLLAAHNRERATVGVEPLRWSADLAASARIWANHLADTGAFEHAPEARLNPEGENLWAGSKGYFSAEAMVNAWLREKRFYKPGVFPNNSVTGRVSDVGHYTQVIWRDTSQVGCAIARGAREDILVCRYSQAGNYMGEQPV